jgi:hypothetical protein
MFSLEAQDRCPLAPVGVGVFHHLRRWSIITVLRGPHTTRLHPADQILQILYRSLGSKYTLKADHRTWKLQGEWRCDGEETAGRQIWLIRLIGIYDTQLRDAEACLKRLGQSSFIFLAVWKFDPLRTLDLP